MITQQTKTIDNQPQQCFDTVHIEIYDEVVQTPFTAIPNGCGFLHQNQPYIRLTNERAYGLETKQVESNWQGVWVEKSPVEIVIFDGDKFHPRALIRQKTEYYVYVQALCATYHQSTALTIPASFLTGTVLPETNMTTAGMFRTANGQFALALPDGTSFWFSSTGQIREQDSAALVYPLKAYVRINQNTYPLYDTIYAMSNRKEL